MPTATSLRARLALPAATLAVAALVVLSLFVGVYDLTAGPLGEEMFWITRVPRAASLVLAGCAMAVSGLVMQLLTQNRFVEPSTTGTSEWAALGLLVTVLLVPESPMIVRMIVASVAAFIGALVFLGVLRRIALRSSLVVPLIGIMLGAVVSAFTTLLAVSTNSLQMLSTWFMGSFTAVVRGRYEVLWIVAVIVLLVAVFAHRLTAASLGEDVATNLGVNYGRTLLAGTALVALATGVTTVVVGFLPFIGLIVPNLVTLWRGDNLRKNLPWVCLGGVAIIVVCDLIGRTVRMPYEVPVSMVLGVVGAAVFITLLLRQRRNV